MRGYLAAFCAAMAVLGSGAQAQSNLVVVELFTSQGCSSCPPADAILGELAERDDVLPLALHVDYWDYIGWKDSFARPEHTRRQKAYAYAAGQRTIYTPQMIVGGVDHVVGNKPMQLAKFIEDRGDQPAAVEISLTRDGSDVVIRAEPAAGTGTTVVQIVRYKPKATVEIRAGENAGRTITYSNIVMDWQDLGGWDGVEPLEMRAKAPGDLSVAVLVQKAGHKAILGAARLR